MSATLAPSALPHNALRMWTDGRYIFIELPSKGPPCIISYPLHEGGLWRALNVLRSQSFEFAGEPMLTAKPLDAKVALAQSILKQRGIL